MSNFPVHKPNFENIPDPLRDLLWAVWIAEPRPDKPGKYNKPPLCTKTLQKIGSNKPELFSSFNEARTTYLERGCSGVGVLLNGTGLIGVDIDDYEVLIKTKPEVRTWLNKAIKRGVYCEASPSGSGRRLFLYGALPENGRGRKHGSLEIYSNTRFLTVTGHTGKRNGTRVTYQSLIESQDLIDEFLKFLPSAPTSNAESVFSTDRTGTIDPENLPIAIHTKLPGLFMTGDDVLPGRFRSLYEGDIADYKDDHSAADLGLISFARKSGLTADEADALFRSSKLYRDKWDQKRGEVTYGELTISKAYANGEQVALDQKVSTANHRLENPDTYTPIYHLNGMPPRRFAGPQLPSGARLFPLNATSTMVGLGGTGKTTTALSIATHIAAGKPWNHLPLESRKVVFASVEETQDELNRKFGATTDKWSPSERNQAIANLRLISLHGKDARLTAAKGRQVDASGWTQHLITFCHEFELTDGVIFLDHLQGLASGDLNLSDTATAICREANNLASATASAVVILSHTSKGKISTTSAELNQGFASGSLAFENAMRQTIGLVPISDEEAKVYGVSEERKDYVWLGLPKNSYGEAESGIWLKRSYNSRFHTVTIEPAALEKPTKPGYKSGSDRILDCVLKHIESHPWTTKNAIEKLAGLNSNFKASAKAVRKVIDAAVESGVLNTHVVTATDRSQHNLSKQVKEVLRAPG